ncbi:MAG: cadmium-translocating P-type ATPase [Chloroflexi bacterium]|nr:MAG: cadmium-translocating P-type ATPase [Chloroflexota bacterium]
MKQTTQEKQFQISGMDCASCARTIESGIKKLPGVDTCSLNFSTETLRVSGTVSDTEIIERIRELGYDVQTPSNQETTIAPPSFWQFLWERQDTRLALVGALLILPSLLFNELLPGLGIHHPVIEWLAVLAMGTAGLPVFRSAWQAVRINREININVLMSLAAIGALFIGAYTEAGLVMVLFAIGEAMEGYTTSRARHAIRSLMAVVPNEAMRLKPAEGRVSVNELAVGDVILVKPGEQIPMDGRIRSGHSSVNQTPITGESRLIEKQPGDEVFASSINGEGVLIIEVTHRAEDNTISRLIRMVEEAQEHRAPAQRFVDRFARYYTPAVVVLAMLVAIIPPLFFGEPFWPTGASSGWLYRGLTLLVVACPCALVISTPVSLISAISNGARHGVLFKGGAHLETLSQVRGIAFDKTGTLTEGRPSVVRYEAAACVGEASCVYCDDLLALTSAVEEQSNHPLAQAVLSASEARGVNGRYPAANNVQTITGKGIQGEINGRQIFIGSHTYFDSAIPHTPYCQTVRQADEAGLTTMLVSQNNEYVGFLAVADKIRPSTRTVIKQLQELGINRLVMLTGDNATTAQKIAEQAGITEVYANCLPEDKVKIVSTLRNELGTVAMVGDGINDTPALAAASVGIAIGNTAQAMETADIVLMNENLDHLPFAIRLSRATMKTIQANIALSIGTKLLFLLLVLAGLGSMWLAVLADVGTSLLVTLNGMRRLKSPTPLKPVLKQTSL